MQASGKVVKFLAEGKPIFASINFFPDYDDDDWLDDEDDWLTDDESDYGDEGSFVLYKKSSSNKPSAKQFWRDYNHNMKELRKIFQ